MCCHPLMKMIWFPLFALTSSNRQLHRLLTEAAAPKVRAGLAGLILVSSCWSSSGLGIRIADQDPLATARGNAFAATADNPSAIYYNPAGITQLEGHQASVGVYAVSFSSQFTGAGVQFETKDKPQAVPQIYYVFSPRESDLSFGLGIYSPYGLSLEWPERLPGFRTLAAQGRITYLTFQPVIAWQLHPTLSIGAGPTINYADTALRRGLLSPFPTDELRFSGDDLDVGFSLGLRWQPHEQHAFGLTYRNASTMNFSGQSQIQGTGFTDGNSTANARLPFPQNVVAGWSFRPTRDWNLEFNVDWTDWNRLDTVVLNQAGFPLLPAVALPFNWRSSFFYEWGVTRYFEHGWRASAGYIFSENSIPDSSFNPLVPDSDRHIFSVGVGRQYDRARWDFAYQLAYGPSRSVTGSPPSIIGQSADGQYEFISHALTFSIGYKF